MTLEVIRSMLAWCMVINFGLLIVWFLILNLAHDWVYRYHSQWFKLPIEQFDTIHYSGMVAFKLGILLLNLAPYLALRIVG